MKKVFFLFGIAAFSSATAQQKDVFDIQKHLQKKQAEAKKGTEEKKYVLPPFMKLQSVPPFIKDQHNESYTLANGDIVLFGNGSMPCIKPDMSQFHTMPDIAANQYHSYNFYLNGTIPGQIPNGASPHNLLRIK